MRRLKHSEITRMPLVLGKRAGGMSHFPVLRQSAVRVFYGIDQEYY